MDIYFTVTEEVPKLRKSYFNGEVFAYFSCIACVVYTKTIFHLVVGEYIYIINYLIIYS